MKMNKAIGMLAGAALLIGMAVPAKSAIVSEGITYTIDTANLDTSTASFIIHITGINGVSDTRDGRFGVESFAFTTNSLLVGLSGLSTFGTFQARRTKRRWL